MKPSFVLFLLVATFFGSANHALAIWSVSNAGLWSDTWPKEFEPLRKQSRTLTGGQANLTFHEIPFRNRDSFEAIWPQILKIRSKGVPITLLRSPHSFLGTLKAGVRIWAPPYQSRNIWLVVDGDIVDLNRISLPADTPVLDLRFEGAVPADDLPFPEGTWKPVAAMLNGALLPREAVNGILLKVWGDNYEVTVKGESMPDRGTFTIDTSTTPRRMTIKGVDGPNKDKTILAIFEMKDGVSMRVCYDLSGQEFPKDFKAPKGTQLYLAGYRRQPATVDAEPSPGK